MTVFSSAIFSVLGYVYWSTVSYISEQTDRNIAGENAVLLRTYRDSGENALVALVDRLASNAPAYPGRYLLADPAMGPVAGNIESWPQLPGVPARASLAFADVRPPNGLPRYRAAFQTLPNGYYLLVGRETDDVRRFRRNMAAVLLWAAGLFLALAAAAGLSTSRRSVARIEAINATSREIIETGLRERIPVRGTGDEWDGLAANLNSMLDRIADLVEWNRRISDNIAHDLRTPLTRLRGRLEDAYGRRPDASGHQKLIGDAIGELDGILGRFSSLLRIAQLENRERMAGFGMIDLNEIAREVIELFEPAAEQAGTSLVFVGGSRVIVVGDRDLLFDAASNLVDNAIRHGGGGVRVTVSRAEPGPILAVADRGPGIPTSERQHVLRRHYRLERSRSSPGTGLGLSLVAAVANLHGAHIEMTDNAPGLRIELHFPPPQKGASAPAESPALVNK